MSAIVNTLQVSDDAGDSLMVDAHPTTLEIRTTGGRIVVLDRAAVGALRVFLTHHLPPKADRHAHQA